jgi:hypothetical protein
MTVLDDRHGLTSIVVAWVLEVSGWDGCLVGGVGSWNVYK